MGPDYPLKRRLQQLEIGKNMIVVRLQFSIELQIRQFVSVSWDVKISPIYGMWLCTCPNLITGFVTRLTRQVPLVVAGTVYSSGGLEFTPGFE